MNFKIAIIGGKYYLIGRKLLKRSDEVMLNYADDGMLIAP